MAQGPKMVLQMGRQLKEDGHGIWEMVKRHRARDEMRRVQKRIVSFNAIHENIVIVLDCFDHLNAVRKKSSDECRNGGYMGCIDKGMTC